MQPAKQNQYLPQIIKLLDFGKLLKNMFSLPWLWSWLLLVINLIVLYITGDRSDQVIGSQNYFNQNPEALNLILLTSLIYVLAFYAKKTYPKLFNLLSIYTFSLILVWVLQTIEFTLN